MGFVVGEVLLMLIGTEYKEHIKTSDRHVEHTSSAYWGQQF